MEQTLTNPVLGLEDEFPDSLFVIHHPESGKYGCFRHEGVHGLACFSSEANAFRFAELIELTGMVSLEVSFDEARDIAKERPAPIVCLMLLDSLTNPKIHYVR